MVRVMLDKAPQDDNMSDTETLNQESLPIRTKLPSSDMSLHLNPVSSGNGLIIKVQTPQAPARPVDHVPCDIVLVIDVSGSMAAEAPVPGESQAESVGLTVLDLTKHAALTVLETMDERDRLGIVTFAYKSHVVQKLEYMTPGEKAVTKKNIERMQPEGATNLWHGIRDGIKIFNDAEKSSNVPALIVLTDGMPNHMCPQIGYIPKLRAMGPLPASIHTFGFGYSLRSGLLKSIAEIGGGNYAFIPDAGMIGTVFVHAVANLQAACGTGSWLELTYPEEVQLEETAGASVVQRSPVKVDGGRLKLGISLGNLLYGQSRDVFLRVKLRDKEASALANCIDAKLTYTATLQDRQQTKKNRPLESTILQSCSLLDATDLTDAEIAYHESRSQICSFLSAVFPAGSDGERRLRDDVTPQTREGSLDLLIRSIPAKDFQDAQNVSLMEDLTGAEPKGQISLAIKKQEYFQKWGMHYLLSYLNAHTRQICNSFKDPGPLQYGVDSPLFIACRDKLDDAFDNLPPPQPSAPRLMYSQRGAQGKPAMNKFSMSSWRNSSGVCFAGSTAVELASGRAVEIRRLRRGVKVRTPAGPRKVAMVLKTRVEDEVMCRLGGSGMLVTPWHPIAQHGGKSWVFPAQVAGSLPVRYTGAIYSVMLQQDANSDAHAIRVGGSAWGVTLGHGILTGRDVRAHAYFGDYLRVGKALVRLGAGRGGVVLGGGVERDRGTGRVTGFKGVVDGRIRGASVMRRAGLAA